MAAHAIFPSARARTGMYESFYLRAVSPTEPVGVWLRHTVHKAPGERPQGSVWCTVFDASRGRPYMHKLSTDELSAPGGDWIRVGESTMGPGRAEGRCGQASWSLRFDSNEPELLHLSPHWLYRLPLPRTKLTSPAPAARFSGVLELVGREPLMLEDWHGMVGHNWGAEHAERWIWLHGVDFHDAPDAWLDVALGRIKLAGRLTPWVANGALSVGGRRWRIGGLGARGTSVDESATGCSLRLAGEDGLSLHAAVEVPGESAAGWRYADPDGGLHDVVNCSVASLDLSVVHADGSAPVDLRSDHGVAYELGMRERDHGVPIAAFTDG